MSTKNTRGQGFTRPVKKFKPKKKLRKIEDPFVVAPPPGVSVKTRIRVTDEELGKVLEIGMFLGALQREDLVNLLHRMSNGDDKAWAERKRDLTVESSARWAGSMTRVSHDLYDTAMRNLQAYVLTLQTKVNILRTRTSLAFNSCDVKTRVKSYSNKHDKAWAKRRLAGLEHKLTEAENKLKTGKPSIVVGGRSLFRNRFNLDTTGCTLTQWGRQWAAKRMFLTADGETGKHFGNETVWVDGQGFVHIKVPAGLTHKYGTHLTLTTPVEFAHKSEIHKDRILTNHAVGYTISYDPSNGRLYLTASWSIPVPDFMPLPAHLRSMRHLAVDLNADHIAAWVVDRCGNPVGQPYRIDLKLAGLGATTRDAYVRHAITTLINIAKENGCGVIAVENLNFADARLVGKEQFGKGGRGKKFRNTIMGMPTAQFRDRLTAMAYVADLWIIAVDPAYTSRWAKQHWLKPLQNQQNLRRASEQVSQTTVTGHSAAAVCVGRRSHGLSLRRKIPFPALAREISVGQAEFRPEGDKHGIGLKVERINTGGKTRTRGYTGASPPL